MNSNTAHQSQQLQQDPWQQRDARRHGLEGPRWWWAPAGVSAVVSTALVAILMTATPGSAIPIEVDRYAEPTPAPGARVPVAEPPDLPEGWRQCFMWQSRWNAALDGPQPLCPEDADQAQSAAAER